MVKKKTGTGVVTKVGYNDSNQTVVFLRGNSVEVFGANFRATIESGDFQSYEPDYTRTLVGKEVQFTFSKTDEKFVPQGVKFIKFTEEV